ncbi:CRISPR-associated helicase/endonuclease Cas3 [Deinococcus apachensis]|uniref:CRISPR-associated helicase/endonuclease Cas3 n=1 Tax=Deinococcus apachensis TaxID=309886 RepID=UPI0003713FF1|nr:CRISPR-associated helicase/endonuclease Cas3 [Deinococcus apachensis]
MTSPDTPPPGSPQSRAVQVLWAKSGQKSAGEGWLPVLHHLLDVGACAAAILEREPATTRDLLAADLDLAPGEGTDLAVRWTSALAALHDLGKASPAFQHKAAPLAERVWKVLPWQDHRENTPHGLVTQKLLPDLLTARGWASQVASRIAQAVGCHHGQRERTPRAPDRGTGPEWHGVQDELVTLVLTAFGLQDEPAPPVTEFGGGAFMRLAGLTSFADWVGSSFPLRGDPDPLPFTDPATYLQGATVQARAALDAIGWTARQPLTPHPGAVDDTFAFLPGFRARPLQTLLADLLSTPDPRPALILVEAPMGEGKTEAALYTHLQLQNAAGHRGLYLALPTQATGNAMYRRLRTFLNHQAAGRPDPITVDLQLLHGGASMQGDYQQDLTNTRARSDAQQAIDLKPNTRKDEGDMVRAAEWFSHRKRALLGEYGVGTVDQALLGVLNVNHQFVRLWGLGNRVVVLDEVHAYDTYTTQLIHALVRWLRALNSSVVIMSATLPAQTRQDLLNAWNVTPDAAPTYPRLTVARAGDPTPTSRPIPGPRRAQTLTLRATDPDPGALAVQAVTLAEAGGTVTVLVNTVQRAQDIFRAVRTLLGPRFQSMCWGSKHPEKIGVHLYHARYPAQDRGEREERVLRYLGPQPATYLKNGTRHTDDVRPERFILIATQVAEQSLDFDTDVLITDLAPIDLILQRAGRLHRHDVNTGRRGAHETPTLYVAGLGDWPEAALDEYQWKYVYAPALMYRTWHALQGRTHLTLPNDLDPLVQRVYDLNSPALDNLSEEQQRTLLKADRALQTERRNQTLTGGLAHIGQPDTFLDLPPQPSLGEPDGEPAHDDASATTDDTATEAPHYGTRLGDDSLRIVPIHHNGADTLDEKGDHSAQIETLQKHDWDTARAIYARSLQVSRHDIVRHYRDHPTRRGGDHAGWAAHPLLRDTEPLILINNQAVIGKTRVILDPELGLVYERLE